MTLSTASGCPGHRSSWFPSHRSETDDKLGRSKIFRSLIIATALLVTTAVVAQSDPVGQTVEVNGMNMYYEVSGAGEPLIVLHGAYMTISTMGDLLPKLAKTHKVIALEFQGHGRTNDIDRSITYPNLADDVAAFMDAIGVEKADIYGYSMGAAAGLQLAIRHPDKVDQLVAVSVTYDLDGAQPEFKGMVDQMVPEWFLGTPLEREWKKLAVNPEGFRPFVEKMISLEHEPMKWEADVRALKTPVLIVAGDSDVVTLEHAVAMFRLLGGGGAGDLGNPPPASRLAVLPATSHTAVPTQTELLYGFIEPLLQGEFPRSMMPQ